MTNKELIEQKRRLQQELEETKNELILEKARNKELRKKYNKAVTEEVKEFKFQISIDKKILYESLVELLRNIRTLINGIDKSLLDQTNNIISLIDKEDNGNNP